MRAIRDASRFRYAEADESPGFLLWKVTALWQGRLSEVFEPFGINQTQYAILASIAWFVERGELPTQSHLAAHAKLDKMTLSKAIRRLESDGLVRRAQSAADARATEVRLTAKGTRLAGQAIVAVENADESFFGVLSPDARAAYKDLMSLLVRLNA